MSLPSYIIMSDMDAWRQTAHAAAIFVFLSLPDCMSEKIMSPAGSCHTERMPHHIPLVVVATV